MADIKEVIKGLKDIQKHLDTGYSFAISWKSELIRDTLTMLKEQDKLLYLQHEALRGSSDTISYLFYKIKSITDGETPD